MLENQVLKSINQQWTPAAALKIEEYHQEVSAGWYSPHLEVMRETDRTSRKLLIRARHLDRRSQFLLVFVVRCICGGEARWKMVEQSGKPRYLGTIVMDCSVQSALWSEPWANRLVTGRCIESIDCFFHFECFSHCTSFCIRSVESFALLHRQWV